MAEQRILKVAIASRAVVSLLSVATALLVEPYDTSSRLLAPAAAPLAAFTNWDGVYFTHIATSGYDYEQVHAFFPLYPLLVRYLSRSLPLHESTAIPLAGWIISNASFVVAALYLYRLGCLILRDEAAARRAAYLFCIAPSSIFMSAVYTESLMCLLSFAGMYYVELYRQHRSTASLFAAAAIFGGASATRSNGALLSLYIAWYRLRDSPSPVNAPLLSIFHWAVTALLGLVSVGPQVVYFIQAIRVYCPSLVAKTLPAAVVPSLITDDRPWCSAVVPNVSAMYMFIQREYWNVGILRYYEWKQLPNFLLAAPVLLLSIYSLARFFLFDNGTRRMEKATPYFVHWGFLVVNALLVVHIQVTTRLLSACPPLFWAPAVFFFDAKRVHTSGKVVVLYFLTFVVLGAGLFSSFYPWT